jgi:hypothetical protein
MMVRRLALQQSATQMNILAGAKLGEDRRWKTLSEDVHVLRCSGHIKNTNNSSSDLVKKKMQVNLDVHNALMLQRISQEIDCTNIVAIHKSSMTDQRVEFLQ